jgi:hypothetical protein
VLVLVCLASQLALAGACVKVQPATDTSLGASPTSPSSTTSSASGGSSGAGGTITLAYTPDLLPVFASDCVVCHGGARVDAGYSMTSYAQVMRAVVPGNAASLLVIVTQPSGSMYPFFSGNRAAKAQMVFDWVVGNGAAQTR